MNRLEYQRRASTNRRNIRLYAMDVAACAYSDSPGYALNHLYAMAALPMPAALETEIGVLIQAQASRRAEFVRNLAYKKRARVRAAAQLIKDGPFFGHFPPVARIFRDQSERAYRNALKPLVPQGIAP